jgi:hypothetical protein
MSTIQFLQIIILLIQGSNQILISRGDRLEGTKRSNLLRLELPFQLRRLQPLVMIRRRFPCLLARQRTFVGSQSPTMSDPSLGLTWRDSNRITQFRSRPTVYDFFCSSANVNSGPFCQLNAR